MFVFKEKQNYSQDQMYLTLILLFSSLSCKMYLHASYYNHLLQFHFSPLGLRLQTYKQNVKIIKHIITSETLLCNAWCCFCKLICNKQLSFCNYLSMTTSVKEMLLIRLDNDSPQLWRIVYRFRNLRQRKYKRMEIKMVFFYSVHKLNSIDLILYSDKTREKKRTI